MVQKNSTPEALVEQLNDALIADELTPYRIGIADPKLLAPQDVNAHFMPKNVYDQLVANVQRDGNLSSMPFCWKKPTGEMSILSGHHRVEAAIQAGAQKVLFLYTDAKLNEQQRIAIQLSHNSLVGLDDTAILKEQWAKLRDVSLKLYSGLDDRALKTFNPVLYSSYNEASLRVQTIELQFLSTELEAIKTTFEKLNKSARHHFAARMEDFEPFLEAFIRLKESSTIYNSSTAFLMLIRAAELIADFMDDYKREPTGEELEVIHDKLNDEGLID